MQGQPASCTLDRTPPGQMAHIGFERVTRRPAILHTPAGCKAPQFGGEQRGKVVGVEGFEPPALWSQTRCATRLRYTPTAVFLAALWRLGKRLIAGPGRKTGINRRMAQFCPRRDPQFFCKAAVYLQHRCHPLATVDRRQVLRDGIAVHARDAP